MPNFAGQKGPEIVRGLIEIENTFEKNLASLRNVKKTILDVKATSWHDDYNRYSALFPPNQKTVDSSGTLIHCMDILVRLKQQIRCQQISFK